MSSWPSPKACRLAVPISVAAFHVIKHCGAVSGARSYLREWLSCRYAGLTLHLGRSAEGPRSDPIRGSRSFARGHRRCGAASVSHLARPVDSRVGAVEDGGPDPEG